MLRKNEINIKLFFSSSPVEKCFIFCAKGNQRYRRITKINAHSRYASILNMSVSPRMHQTSNNRYNPNGYGTIRVTTIACGREAPKRHGKTRLLSICILLILPSVIIKNKELLKTRLIFIFYVQISCSNDWTNFLLLNTNAPLNIIFIQFLNRLIRTIHIYIMLNQALIFPVLIFF